MEMTKIVFKTANKTDIWVINVPKAGADDILRGMINTTELDLKAEINEYAPSNPKDYEFTEKHEFYFNFKGGGFNSIYAQTRAEAIAEAKAKYNDEYSEVLEESFSLKNRKDSKAMLRNFW